MRAQRRIAKNWIIKRGKIKIDLLQLLPIGRGSRFSIIVSLVRSKQNENMKNCLFRQVLRGRWEMWSWVAADPKAQRLKNKITIKQHHDRLTARKIHFNYTVTRLVVMTVLIIAPWIIFHFKSICSSPKERVSDLKAINYS